METEIIPLQRIWELIRKERKYITFLYAYAIISGAISLIIPLGIQALMSLVLGGHLTSGWYILVIIITVGVFIAGLTRLAQMSILETIQQRVFVNTAFEFTRKITGASLKKKKHHGLMELSEKFLDVITVQKSFSKLILDFSASLLQIVFGLILLIAYHPYFLIFGSTVIIVVALVLRLTWSRGIHSARVESDYKFKTAFWITEVAQNRTIFNLKSLQGFHLKKTDVYLDGYLKGRKEHFRILYSQAFIAVIIKVVLTSALIILGSYLLVQQDISLGQFLASEILILTLLSAVEKMILTVENIYDSGIALEKLGYVTDMAQQSHKEEAAIMQKNVAPALSIFSRKNETSLLEIAPGEKIGICGYPGTGRTRILKTLTGEHQDDWHALINKVPVENIKIDSLGLNTGICFQSNDVFEDTLINNIVLGGEVNMEEMAELTDILNLQKYITSVPGGFMHTVEAHEGLPTNIMRKIILARALYHKPKLLLIDDIWTIFNREEINKIMEYISSMKSTVVIISNYAPVLEKTDRCIFMDETGFNDLGRFDTLHIPALINPIIWL